MESFLGRVRRVIRDHGVVTLLKGIRPALQARIHAVSGAAAAARRERVYRGRLAGAHIVGGVIETDVLGYRMRLRDDDPGISRDLLIDGIRERGATRLMERLLRGNMTVLECGANLGYYALLEATRLGPESRIYAFEPHPDNFALLRDNLALNGLAERVAVFQAAVSSTTGTATLVVEGSSNFHHLGDFALRDPTATRRITVPAVALDDFCTEQGIAQVDLIRMDVEGHEVEIIAGAERVIERSDDLVVFLEIHTKLIRDLGKDPLTFLRRLERHGLHVFAFTGHDGREPLVAPLTWAYVYRNFPILLADYGTHIFLAKHPDRALAAPDRPASTCGPREAGAPLAHISPG